MIKPVGPLDAKIVLVGEAPGEKEIEAGLPFVGMAGRVLDSCLAEAGIDRAKCYITNVMLTRPTGNDFGLYYEDKTKRKPKPELQAAIERLHSEIAVIDPNVIVALGDEAVRALVGERGISNWRGSVLQGVTGHKVIPAFHPASVAREWAMRPTLICDLQRAKEQSEFKDIRQTVRTLVVAYSYDEAVSLLTEIKEHAQHVAFDIETETEQITCIGLSPSHRPNWAVCIPFWFGASGSLFNESQEIIVWELVRSILESPKIDKYAQNGMFDIEVLRRTMGINVRGFKLDTMLAFHCLYAELPKGLDFLVSLYTDHPYYKHQLKSTSMDEFFRYNATDACLTREIAVKLAAELEECRMVDFYERHVHALVEPLLMMQQTGVKFNYLRRNSVKKRVQEEIAVLQRNLDAAVGRPININSPKQMKEWLYGPSSSGGLALKERVKRRKDTGEETVAADEEALKSLYTETGNDALRLVLQIREKQKMLGTYLEVALDDDKRIRCSYLISGTETGRLSSRSTLRGTGTNLQNIPNGVVKSLFVPDDGKVFINADLSQAEARVVAYLAADERFIKVFSEGGDIHKKNASNIFGIHVDDVTEEQRQLAKRVVHASNYGMGPRTFAKTAGISEKEATRLLNQYFATYPGIKLWHQRTGEQLRRARVLTNPLGRKRLFFNRWEETLLKEALAFVPQSTVADIMNAGLVELHARRESVVGFDILLQVHDSLLCQAPTENVEAAIGLIGACLTRPVVIGNRTLVIPVDYKIGKNWEELEKWKSPQAGASPVTLV